jgi:hypothetical protein
VVGRDLDEVQRNLPKLGLTPEKAAVRVQAMRDAFGAEALVDDFDDLIGQMACDPKDRHVLAAAVRAEADEVVTFNLKDFPDAGAQAVGVQILHPDNFLISVVVEDPDRLVSVLEHGVAVFKNPAQSVEQFLALLTPTVPAFANLAADAWRDHSVRSRTCPRW